MQQYNLDKWAGCLTRILYAGSLYPVKNVKFTAWFIHFMPAGLKKKTKIKQIHKMMEK